MLTYRWAVSPVLVDPVAGPGKSSVKGGPAVRKPQDDGVTPPQDRKDGSRDRGLAGAGSLFELAFTFAGTLLAGMAIGYYGGRWLDRWLGTGPWLQLVGLMLGVVAAFRSLWRTLQRFPDGGPEGSGQGPDGPHQKGRDGGSS